jgi:hypothetical protein
MAVAYALYFIKYNTTRLVYPEQSDNGCNNSYTDHDLIVGAREQKHIRILNTIGSVIIVLLDDGLRRRSSGDLCRCRLCWSSHGCCKDAEYLHEAGQERRCGLQVMRLLLQMRQEPTRAVVMR